MVEQKGWQEADNQFNSHLKNARSEQVDNIIDREKENFANNPEQLRALAERLQTDSGYAQVNKDGTIRKDINTFTVDDSGGHHHLVAHLKDGSTHTYDIPPPKGETRASGRGPLGAGQGDRASQLGNAKKGEDDLLSKLEKGDHT